MHHTSTYLADNKQKEAKEAKPKATTTKKAAPKKAPTKAKTTVKKAAPKKTATKTATKTKANTAKPRTKKAAAPKAPADVCALDQKMLALTNRNCRLLPLSMSPQSSRRPRPVVSLRPRLLTRRQHPRRQPRRKQRLRKQHQRRLLHKSSTYP